MKEARRMPPPTGLQRISWLSLETAMSDLGGKLATADGTHRRVLRLPGLTENVAVAASPCLRYYVIHHCLGACPSQDDGWAADLATAGHELYLARFALAGGQLTLRAEIPAMAETALVSTLRLLEDDLAVGQARYRLISEQRQQREERSKALAIASPEAQAMAHQAVDIALAEVMTAGWQVMAQGEGYWRLVRASWAPPGLPPAAHLRLGATILAVESVISLQDGATPAIRQALGLFLLQGNARYLARAALERVPGFAVNIAIGLPLGDLQPAQIVEALHAVAVAYEAERREVAALRDPAVAQCYLNCYRRPWKQ